MINSLLTWLNMRKSIRAELLRELSDVYNAQCPYTTHAEVSCRLAEMLGNTAFRNRSERDLYVKRMADKLRQLHEIKVIDQINALSD
jgi:aminoglycoside phosphotransferase